MRKLKIMEHISLDGVIQISAGPKADSDFPYGDWTRALRQPCRVRASHSNVRRDLRSGDWPPNLRSVVELLAKGAAGSDGGPTECSDEICRNPPAGEPGWGPFEGIGPDLVKSVCDIKAKDGADLIVSGSSTLTSALLEHGLADELVLLVDPVLLGKGRRLFAEGTPAPSLALQSSEALPWASSSTSSRPLDLCRT